eukprot:2120120-Amphidinium_carterae.1
MSAFSCLGCTTDDRAYPRRNPNAAVAEDTSHAIILMRHDACKASSTDKRLVAVLLVRHLVGLWDALPKETVRAALIKHGGSKRRLPLIVTQLQAEMLNSGWFCKVIATDCAMLLPRKANTSPLPNDIKLLCCKLKDEQSKKQNIGNEEHIL